MSAFVRQRLPMLLVAVVLALPCAAAQAVIVEFQEDLGNFPDAVEITGGIDFRNGVLGVVFGVRNTSFGDGGASSFESDPDGDFADNDVLTTAARAAISAAQPFGIYFFNAKLPEEFDIPEVTANVARPALFEFTTEDSDDAGFREFNFELDLSPAEGLLFDDAVSGGANGGVPNVFTDPRFGTLEFFIPAPAALSLQELIDLVTGIQIRNSPGIDVSTNMAWQDSSGAIEFELFNEELRPRGEIQSLLVLAPVPAPATLLLALWGLLAVGARRRA
jgi:hypothetical protein